MQLYLFNNIKIKPYVILIVKVLDEKEYEYIQNNFTNIFEILIGDGITNNGLADSETSWGTQCVRC